MVFHKIFIKIKKKLFQIIKFPFLTDKRSQNNHNIYTMLELAHNQGI